LLPASGLVPAALSPGYVLCKHRRVKRLRNQAENKCAQLSRGARVKHGSNSRQKWRSST
jgi:hypothetical protein